VERFDVDVDEGTHAVHARFDPRSLKVMGAVKEGHIDPGELSEGDKEKIQHNITDDVLETKSHPEITFHSTSVTRDGEGYRIEGELMLHGKARPIVATAKAEGDKFATEVRIHQPDFKIKPYTAMLGTLKVKPDVTVRLELPRA
jgi:polyisoprenoid-binding protein YceI